MVLVPPSVQSRIQAARNATKHKKANFSSSTIQPQVTNEKEELEETGSFFSYLDSNQTEEHAPTVRVGPCMPQTNNQPNLYHFEDSSTTEDTKNSQQQAITSGGVEDRLTEGLNVNTSSQLDPEAVSFCVHLSSYKYRRFIFFVVEIFSRDMKIILLKLYYMQILLETFLYML